MFINKIELTDNIAAGKRLNDKATFKGLLVARQRSLILFTLCLYGLLFYLPLFPILQVK
jgi:hypothetical protein